MTKNIITLFLLLLKFVSHAQVTYNEQITEHNGVKISIINNDTIHWITDIPVKNSISNDSLQIFVNYNFRCPKIFQDCQFAARVILRFCVTYNGEVKYISKIAEMSEMKEIEDELVRIFNLLPMWIPAKIGSENVSSWHHQILRIEW